MNDPNSFGAMFTAIGLALALGDVLGSINGLLVAVVGLQPFISTLVMMLAARGIARVITGGQNTNATNEPFRRSRTGRCSVCRSASSIAIAIVVIVALVMRRTALGLMIESIGINPHGEPAGRHPSPSHPDHRLHALRRPRGCRPVCSRVSEVMTVDVSGTGYQMELDAILAVVIGGTSLAGGKFSILGSTIGALLIATLNKTVLFLGIPAAATPAFKALVIIVLCLLQSERIRRCLRTHESKASPRRSAAEPPHGEGGRGMSARRLADSVPPGRTAREPAAQQVSALSACGSATSRSSRRSPPSLLLFAMLVYAEIAYGRVFHAGTMSSLLVSFAPTIILAVGMTFVILSGGIDLSVGAVVAFSSVAGVMLMNIGVNGWLSMLLMIVFGAVFGLISGVMIQYFDVQPFIATLAMMFLARGLASILSTVPGHAPEDSPIHLLGHGLQALRRAEGQRPRAHAGLHHRRPRRDRRRSSSCTARVWAARCTRIGGAESSAQLMGLPVARTRVWIYVISGALAGLAAVVYTAEVGGKAQNVTGIGWELDAIAAVVIGGTLLTGGAGYVLGSVVGSLVLAALWMIITKDGTIRPRVPDDHHRCGSCSSSCCCSAC